MIWVVIALLAVVTAIELLMRKGSWRPRLLNLQLWAINMAAMAVLLPLAQFAAPFSLIQGPLWLSVALFVLAMDLGEYSIHRAQHKFPILWRFHSLHHSDEDMNATTAFRTHWLDMVVQQVVMFAFASLVARPTLLAVLAYAAISGWKIAQHSAVNFDFGRWNWILTSSAYHRRHHSRLPEHYNTNFAAMFPIYDVICGTYRQPEGYPPTGLDTTPRHIGEALLWPAKYPVRSEERRRLAE